MTGPVTTFQVPAKQPTARFEAVTPRSVTQPSGYGPAGPYLRTYQASSNGSHADAAVGVQCKGGWATGVCIAHQNGQAVIMTCKHVVDEIDGQAATVRFADGRIVESEKDIRVDKQGHDLAAFLVKTDRVPRVAPLAASEPQAGESVTLPGFHGGTFQQPAGRVLRSTSFRDGLKEFIVSAIGAPGGSGSPVLNSRGETVGIFWGVPKGRKDHSICTSCRPAREFIQRCGWFAGPNINIVNPPAASQPMPSTGPDPATTAQVASLQARVDSIAQDMQDVRLTVNTFDSRLQRAEFTIGKVEEAYQIAKEHYPAIKEKVAKLDADFAAKADAVARDFDAKIVAEVAAREKAAKEQEQAIMSLASKAGDAAGTALRAENASAQAKDQADRATAAADEAKTESAQARTKVQELYAFVPKEVKAKFAAEIHEHLDKHFGADFISGLLKKFDDKLTGRDVAIGVTGIGVLGTLGLLLLRTRHPVAARIITAAAPAGAAIIGRIRKRKNPVDGTEEDVIEQVPATPTA